MLGVFALLPVRFSKFEGSRSCYCGALGALFVELIFQCGLEKINLKWIVEMSHNLLS
jgi:hypothetical protein